MNNNNEMLDLAALGFDEIKMNYKGGNGRADSDYLLAKGKDGNNGAELSFSPETLDLIRELLGDGNYRVAMNDEGKMVVTGGGTFTPRSTNSKSLRYSITVSNVLRKAVSVFGRFKRIYYKPKVYANGDAVLFVPTGERD